MGLLLLDSYAATTGLAYQVAVNAGNAQSATVNTGLAVIPQVIVEDSVGNPVSGTQVIFALSTGTGTVSGLTQTTNASGLASIGSWSLGTTAGSNSITAAASGLTGSPVVFTATGLGAAPFTVAIYRGNGQIAVPGTPVAIQPQVLLSDQYGNAASASTVTFAVATGGGSVSPTAVRSVNGIAAASVWTLGVTVGSNSLTATASGVTGSPLTFLATASGGGPVDRTNTIWVQPWGINPWVRLPEVRPPTIVHP